MQLHEPGTQVVVLEVKPDRFQDVASELFPSLPFGEDGMSEGSCKKNTFLSVPDLEDQFHEFMILKLSHGPDTIEGDS